MSIVLEYCTCFYASRVADYLVLNIRTSRTSPFGLGGRKLNEKIPFQPSAEINKKKKKSPNFTRRSNPNVLAGLSITPVLTEGTVKTVLIEDYAE